VISLKEFPVQTLQEQKLGVKAIVTPSQEKGWSLSIFKEICRRVDRGGSVIEC